MILFTPCAASDSASAVTAASTSEMTTLRGDEMLGSRGVTAPITPTRCPSVSTTVLAASLPESTRAWSTGSPAKSALADRNVTGGSKPSMKRAVTSGPKSKSWFPSAMAS